MDQTVDTLPADEQVLDLGMLLGQRRAFGMVAGRCSAANAECLRRVRDEKLYLRFAPSWDEFCERRLKISRRSADRVIALLKEHGPLYFEVAELTGVTPAAYRAIKHAIQDDGVHVGGEVIALIPANTNLAIDAVARLMTEAEAAAPAPPSGVDKQIAELEKRGRKLADAFRRVAETANEIERGWLIRAVKNVEQNLGRVELELG